jgi:hypothetical protein
MRGPFSESLSRWFTSNRCVMVSDVFFFVSVPANFVVHRYRVYNACMSCCTLREPRCVVHVAALSKFKN